MERIEERIALMERKLRFNRRLLISWFFLMGAIVVLISMTWGYLSPLPKGTKLEFASERKKSVLSGQALTFYDRNEQLIATIDAAEKYQPYIKMQNPSCEAQLGLHKEGGGELLLRAFRTGNDGWERKARLKVSPHHEEVSLLLSSSDCGEARLGISNAGEPELMLISATGGIIEMRVDSEGKPILNMQDSEGNILFHAPQKD